MMSVQMLLLLIALRIMPTTAKTVWTRRRKGDKEAEVGEDTCMPTSPPTIEMPVLITMTRGGKDADDDASDGDIKYESDGAMTASVRG